MPKVCTRNKTLYKKRRIADKRKKRRQERRQRMSSAREPRPEIDTGCSAQDVQQTPPSPVQVQHNVKSHTDTSQRQQACGHPHNIMEEDWHPNLSSNSVPTNPSQIDILRRKIKVITKEKEVLQEELLETRSKAKIKIKRLKTFYHDMYSGNSRPSKIFVTSLLRHNAGQ